MTKLEPTVSIVMGCYNAQPAHLREAIDSALSQTYPHVDVIVVNDGSTQAETVSALEEYAGRVRIIHQANAGIAAARNAAVAISNADYIQILDSDDILNPDVVEQGVSVLQDPTVEITYSSAKVFGDRNEYMPAGEEFRLADIIEANRITICSMVRRDSWNAVGGQWDKNREIFEDYELWVRLLRDGGIARRTPTAQFHYRVRGNSLSAQLPKDTIHETRKVVLEANPDHHEQLLNAAFERLDDLLSQKLEYADYVKKWQRRTLPVIQVRNQLLGLRSRILKRR